MFELFKAKFLKFLSIFEMFELLKPIFAKIFVKTFGKFRKIPKAKTI